MRVVRVLDELAPNSVLDLSALKYQSIPISALFMQTFKEICADMNGVRSLNLQEDKEKHLSFLRLAKTSEVDLAVTPEYSVPWAIFPEILGERLYPSGGSLWILGFESIKKSELDNLLNDENLSGENAKVIMEDLPNSDDKFLDPLVYLTKIQENGVEKKLVVIQFKTSPMGARQSQLERHNIQPGRNLYLFTNSEGRSFNLFSLVCADAMNFNQMNHENEFGEDWFNKPQIALSLQLNPKPFHDEFVELRKKVLRNKRTDLVSLNHSIETKINGQKIITYGGSSISFYSDDINNKKIRINENERKGMFINYKTPDTFYYYLVPNPYVFKVKLSRPSYTGLPDPVAQKEGPVVEDVYEWSGNSLVCLESLPFNNAFLENIGFEDILNFSSCNLEKERLVNFSVGRLKLGEVCEWYKVENLHSFQLQENDSLKRVVVPFLQGGTVDDLKTRFICDFNELRKIVQDDEEFFKPRNFRRFKGSERMVKFENTSNENSKYMFNVTVTSLRERCTAIYVGDCSKGFPKKIHEYIGRYVGETQMTKVVIWYKFGGKFKFFEMDEPIITDVINLGDIAAG